MSTAAISRSASVSAWNPPHSTSMTTGRNPRNRRAIRLGDAPATGVGAAGAEAAGDGAPGGWADGGGATLNCAFLVEGRSAHHRPPGARKQVPPHTTAPAHRR